MAAVFEPGRSLRLPVNPCCSTLFLVQSEAETVLFFSFLSFFWMHRLDFECFSIISLDLDPSLRSKNGQYLPLHVRRNA